LLLGREIDHDNSANNGEALLILGFIWFYNKLNRKNQWVIPWEDG